MGPKLAGRERFLRRLLDKIRSALCELSVNKLFRLASEGSGESSIPRSQVPCGDTDSAPAVATKGFSQERSARHSIFFVVDSLDLGGTETQMMQLARRLKANGHSVTVGCLHPEGILAQDLVEAGIPVFGFPKPGSLLSLNGANQLLRMALFIRRKKFDVVHAHDLWANLMAVPAGRIAGAPIIISSQRDLGHLYWYTPFRRKVIGAIHRLSARIVANSSAVRKLLVETFRVPPSRVRVLHNSVDFERFASARRDRRQMFPDLDPATRLVAVVANMHSEVKGHHDLIDAARIICRAIPQTSFVLVGDGAERRNIEDHAVVAGVRDHFIFLGRRLDVPEILACCELFTLPSHSEGFPNVILEAMAAGLPVVATQVGGVLEIIEDGQSGLLVPPRDYRALADAIIRVMKDPTLAASLSRNGQQRVQARFSFARLVTETEQLYGSMPA